MTLDEAIDVFIGATARIRSSTYPCIGERVGPVWMYRDADRPRGKYRNEEWIGYGIEPAKFDEIARANTRGQYALSYLLRPGDNAEKARAEFKALKYLLRTTEPFFVHSLEKIEMVECPYSVARVRTVEEADRLSTVTRRRQIFPSQLAENPPTLRQYWATDGDLPVGWVRSVTVGSACWCSNLHVNPECRRKGIGRALMTRMLLEDREAGASANVLLASHTGAMLYPTLGYEQIGRLLVYTPSKTRR